MSIQDDLKPNEKFAETDEEEARAEAIERERIYDAEEAGRQEEFCN